MIIRAFVLFCILCLPLHGGSFRAIIVADTASNLAKPAKKDVEDLKGTLEKICSKTGHTLQLDILDGYLVCHRNIYTLLNNPQKDGSDVLFFYYTGHGFHPAKRTSPWPVMALSASREDLDPQRICQQLSTHAARLTIVLFDCCNSTIDFDIALKQPNILPSASVGKRNLKTLFLENSGTIIASASVPGYPAYAFTQGSLFTLRFIRNLFRKTASDQDTWQSVFSSTSVQCAPFQTPYIFLDLKPKA